MTIKLRAPETKELSPRITVLGVGGAGGNAVNNMIASKLEGVDFVVANTDAQSLSQSKAQRRIQLGARLTEGLGAGARPDVGRAGAEESLEEILEQLAGSHMVFITAGMGGGTGTGAAPVIARAVRELGVLTVGVVTKPFAFEGDKRMRIAEAGIEELQAYVDTLIIIPNQNLFRVANDRTTFSQAFAMADDVLHSGVRGVTDLIVMPGLINLDFADIKTVMSEMGKAMMGTGESEGEERALKAAEAAISNPLLDDVSMKGARGVLINITGGPDMMLFEVDQAANRIRAEVDPDANIIFGGTILENMEGRLRVSVVATGIEAEAMQKANHNNVETLRAYRKPAAATPPPARPDVRAHEVRSTASPVHHQMETLQQEMTHRPQPPVEQPMTPAAQAAPEPEPAPVYHTVVRTAPVRQQLPEPEEAPKRSRFGFLGRREKKPEPQRIEPAQVQRQPQRATAQIIQRGAQPEPQRGAERTDSGDDLFPEHKKDDQFEIPAFLRRQTN